MTPLLEVKAIDVHYGTVQALRGLSLHINEGERVALLGANGAGKSSTLRAISGMAAPTAGEIVFRDEPIAGLVPESVVARGIGHVPEGRELFSGLSVRENLRLGYYVHRRDKKGFEEQLERAFTYFPRLKEREKQTAGTLSGGEQQMLVISRALMSSPQVLLVDELSLGLAPMIVAQLFEILGQVNREGAAIVIVEQFIHMALENTDRAYVLAKGQVVLEGRSSEMRDDPELVATYLGETAEPRKRSSGKQRARGSR